MAENLALFAGEAVLQGAVADLLEGVVGHDHGDEGALDFSVFRPVLVIRDQAECEGEHVTMDAGDQLWRDRHLLNHDLAELRLRLGSTDDFRGAVVVPVSRDVGILGLEEHFRPGVHLRQLLLCLQPAPLEGSHHHDPVAVLFGDVDLPGVHGLSLGRLGAKSGFVLEVVGDLVAHVRPEVAVAPVPVRDRPRRLVVGEGVDQELGVVLEVLELHRRTSSGERAGRDEHQGQGQGREQDTGFREHGVLRSLLRHGEEITYTR